MKDVVITGAGSGIGKATAILFSKKGYVCHLLGRNKQSLEHVSSELEQSSYIYSCDLNDISSIHDTAMDMQIKAKNLWGLIHNAGIIHRAEFITTTAESIEQQFSTNLFGPMELTKKLLPIMIEQGEGVIVNVASNLGIKPIAGTTIYSASKAAMINWTQGLALELGAKGIRVNCVCPGIVETPIHKLQDLDAKEREETLKKMNEIHPLGRMGQPEDIAEAILFLAQSAWSTGSIYTIDGGLGLT